MAPVGRPGPRASSPWSGASWVVTAGALVAVLLVPGCADSPVPGGPTTRDAPATAVPSNTSPAAAAPSVTSSAGFNTTDVAWLQLMSAMNERILPVLELGSERGSDPAVRRLAARAKADHEAELARLRALLDRTGQAAANPHEGHNMPGMITPEDLAAMRQAAGADLDRRFTRSVRAHVDQCVLLARGERQSGASPATMALARDIELARRAQAGQLARLDT